MRIQEGSGRLGASSGRDYTIRTSTRQAESSETPDLNHVKHLWGTKSRSFVEDCRTQTCGVHTRLSACCHWRKSLNIQIFTQTVTLILTFVLKNKTNSFLTFVFRLCADKCPAVDFLTSCGFNFNQQAETQTAHYVRNKSNQRSPPALNSPSSVSDTLTKDFHTVGDSKQRGFKLRRIPAWSAAGRPGWRLPCPPGHFGHMVQ